MGKGARQFGKCKSHSKSTRSERRGYDGGSAAAFTSPEISFLVGSRGADGFSERSAPAAQPSGPAHKVVTAAAKARHQRKKHNRWERGQEEWRAQQKTIEKKPIEKKPKVVAAPKVEVPQAEVDAPPAAGKVPAPHPSGAAVTPTQSKLDKAARRQAVRKAKRRADA